MNAFTKTGIVDTSKQLHIDATSYHLPGTYNIIKELSKEICTHKLNFQDMKDS